MVALDKVFARAFVVDADVVAAIVLAAVVLAAVVVAADVVDAELPLPVVLPVKGNPFKSQNF